MSAANPTSKFMVILTGLWLQTCLGSQAWAQGTPKPEETGRQLLWSKETAAGETQIQVTMEGVIPPNCKNSRCSKNLDFLYFATDGGVLQKLALPSMKEERHLEFKRSIGSLWISHEGLVLMTGYPDALTRDTQLWLIDPATLAVKKTVPAEGMVTGATTPGWAYMLTMSGTKGDPSGKERLGFVDLKTGQKVREHTIEDLAKEAADGIEKEKLVGSLTTQGDDLQISPDGKYLFARTKAGALCRFQIKGVELTCEEMGPTFLGSGDYGFSADSQLVAISARKGSAAKDHPDPGECGIYIYKIDDLKKPIVSLRNADFLGFGKDNRLMAREVSRGTSGVIVTYDSTGTLLKEHGGALPETDASRSPVSQCFVHPQRSRILVLESSELRWYEFKER
jgi:hypothetical protein